MPKAIVSKIWSLTATNGIVTSKPPAVSTKPLAALNPITSKTSSTITFSWIEPVDSTPCVEYEVWRAQGNENWTLMTKIGIVLPGNSASYTHNAAAGQTFQYRVRRVSNTGVFSDYTTPVSDAIIVLPTVGGRFEFAQIPEVVFVNGLNEVEQMGIYQLDPKNRWVPGDVYAKAGWVAKKRCELLNASDNTPFTSTYVKWNKEKATLTYTGSPTGQTVIRYPVKMRYGTKVSDTFDITIITPSFTLGDETYQQLTGIAGVPHVGSNLTNVATGTVYNSVGDAFGKLCPSKTSLNNCILITTHANAGTINYYFSPSGYKSIYYLGKPNVKTTISTINRADNRIQPNFTDKVYFKNLDTYNMSIVPSRGRMACLVNLRMGYYSSDTITTGEFNTDTDTVPEKDELFMSNIEWYHCGQLLLHPTYIHGRDFPVGSRYGGNCHVYWNNCSSVGNNSIAISSPTNVTGGAANYKSIAAYNWIRNSSSELSDNWEDMSNFRLSSQATTFHGHQRVVFYNFKVKTILAKNANKTYETIGEDTCIIFQNRTIADGGGDDPAYFRKPDGTYYKSGMANPSMDYTYPLVATYDYTGIPGQGVSPSYSSSVNTRPAAPYHLNPEFHGINDYISKADDRPVFWDNIGATDDPTNTKLYGKFLSYIDYERVDCTRIPPLASLGYFNGTPRSAVEDQGTDPNSPTRQGADPEILWNVPPNWKERSRIWAANNAWSGIDADSVYNYTFNRPLLYAYPYSVGQQRDRNPPIISGSTAGKPLGSDAVLPIGTYSELAKAAYLAPEGQFSPPMQIPSLNTRTPRADVYNPVGSDYPSSVFGTTTDPDASPLDGHTAQVSKSWIWASKGCWDPVRERVSVIYTPHFFDNSQVQFPVGPTPPWMNGRLSLLGIYDEKANQFAVYEAPLDPAGAWTGYAGHMYDNNFIMGRKHYKLTATVYNDGTGAGSALPVGYPGSTVAGLNLDAVQLPTDPQNINDAGYLSARDGAALVENIGRPTRDPAGNLFGPGNPYGMTGPNFAGTGMAWHEELNKVIMIHKKWIWQYNVATATWSNAIDSGIAATNIYHNMAAYNPQSKWWVGGGGCAIDGTTGEMLRNFEWVGYSPTGALVKLDDSPRCFSVFDGTQSPYIVKACLTHIPNSNKFIIFHESGQVYTLDPTAPSGSQWVKVVDALPEDVLHISWICAIPKYGGVIMTFHYGPYGTNEARIFRPPGNTLAGVTSETELPDWFKI